MPRKTQLEPNKMGSNELIPLDKARQRLAYVWLCGAGLIILTVVSQVSLSHRYDNKVPDVVLWLLPTLMPMLGLILTVWGSTALEPTRSAASVRKDFYVVSLCLSVAYLSLIFLDFLVQPMVPADGDRSIQILRQSNLWLGPIQGLVASSLGVLFVSKRARNR